MSLLSALGGTDGTQIFADVGEATGLDPEMTQAGMEALYPAIAAALSGRAQEDPALFGRVAALLAEDSGAADEAVLDGKAILIEIYGSSRTATAAMKKAGGDLPAAAIGKLAPITAVAVAAAAQQQGGAMSLSGALPAAGSGSGGIIGTILSALIAGAIRGALRQLTSSVRSRSSTSSTTSRTRRTARTKPKAKSRTTAKGAKKTAARKRKPTSSALEDILGGILGTRK